MSLVVTQTFSDWDMHCPGSWENGPKDGLVQRFGKGERSLSHPWTGEQRGSTFDYTLIDENAIFRKQLASVADKYWVEPDEIRMTSYENRDALGNAYTVFVGVPVNIQAKTDFLVDVTLTDIISERLFSDRDRAKFPWRRIGDGPLDQFDELHPELDLNTPEGTFYGPHTRTETSPPTAAGYRIKPTKVGKWTHGGTQYYVGLVAGHACKRVDLYKDGVLQSEGSAWLIPTHANWLAEFGDPFVDLRSQTFGNDRRYAFILGVVGNADAEDWWDDTVEILLDVDGVEHVGDGSGTLLTDGFDQYKHFWKNYASRPGQTSYQSGPWLDSPQWDLFGRLVDVVDEASFDTGKALGMARLPPDGYERAAVIGRQAGDRSSMLRWIGDFNRSLGARTGFTREGQLRLVMNHPTAAIKAAAPLYTDAFEILDRSFLTTIGWSEHANLVHGRTDFDPSSGQYKTTFTSPHDLSLRDYGPKDSEDRSYDFAPGLLQAKHIGDLEVRVRAYPPRVIYLEDTIGPDPVTADSLGYRELGDYIKYVHYDAVSETRSERLAQIEWIQIQVGERRVAVRAVDVEDLIDFDAYSPGDPSTASELCALALEIPPDGDAWVLDTSSYPTDDSVEGMFPGPGFAYHAAWWFFTAPADGSLHLNTLVSSYDTQLVVFTGDCDALTFVDYNDNAVFTRAILTLDVVAGETYRVLVCGHGPDDGGRLSFVATFTPA